MKANRTVVAAALALPLVAGAASNPLSTSDPGAVGPDLPEWRAAGDARYICGGIGDREQEFMRQVKGHDLKLTFAARTGQYLADVDVVLRQQGLPILSVRCAAPMMLVDLPRPGTYQVQATAAGVSQYRTLSVPERGHRGAVLRWPVVPDSPSHVLR